MTLSEIAVDLWLSQYGCNMPFFMDFCISQIFNALFSVIFHMSKATESSAQQSCKK